MATTVTHQRRTTRVASGGGAEYTIETYVDDQGDLPDSAIFLLEIVSETDATQDELARVSSVADMTTYLSRLVVTYEIP